MTLAHWVSAGARVLVAAGLSQEDSRRDATVLARWVLKWDAAQWLTHQHREAPPDFSARFDALIERRAAREPVAYLTGVREFFGREFRVSRAVLIPRPETELVVEEALEALTAGRRAARPPLVVDAGTGSGCLVVTLAIERPDARLVATDSSREALDVARENARTFGVQARIEFIADALVPAMSDVDLIVSNPPYVPERDRRSLSADVRDFEPERALFAGEDGLDVIRDLVPAAARALGPGGWLVMEIGHGQARDVTRLVERTPSLSLHHIRDDLQAIPRVVVARRDL